jgi:hypothetical protein
MHRMRASRFDFGLMYGTRLAVGVAFQPGASEGAGGLLSARGFKIIRDRRRSGERNHKSRKNDFRMDEHSPISCSIVARVCSSTQETSERCILFHTPLS